MNPASLHARHVLEIRSSEEECDRVIREITAAAYNYAFDSRSLFEISLAVDEALGNARQHGNQSDRMKRIHVEYAVAPTALFVSIRDEGNGFDLAPFLRLDRPRNSAKARCCGIVLLHRLMSAVQYVPPGNEVRMLKYRADEIPRRVASSTAARETAARFPPATMHVR